ncbi:hypothetical protein SAMN05443287_106207 [Micromonospora phaseoli]|uniref:Uncharacterized protein n=1 Tax=Micromonospora phaseoli TaxID=1144548 RepID=A0A1H7AW59_9ACTN|nr:hypothetical protein [Micromonospora phaseoli]GIJ75983.1 hypothetical protein Xph01_04150 [Micromonospora phaseoli]SEJ66342.1 hypothetical protein SAMN05443287_106207 [Micromonospora phaseoli]
MDWGTLIGTLAGAVVGGGLTIFGKSFEGRQRRREARDARAAEAGLAIRASLLSFRRIFVKAQDPHNEPLDTSEPWWSEEVDGLRSEVLLVTEADARKRFEQVTEVLSLIESAPRFVDNGEEFEEIGYDVIEEALQLLGAYIRGDRLPDESDTMRRCRAAAETTRTKNLERWRQHVAQRAKDRPRCGLPQAPPRA